jgi:DNA-binding NtrC family response regulator
VDGPEGGFSVRLELASLSHVEGWAEQPLGKEARILLVSEDLRELAYYHAILEKLGCKVRPSSSFAEGVRRLGCEPFDLIMVDEGRRGFKGQKVLAQAMEVDVELRVLVLARTYHKGCHLEAMRSGALDYLEGPLSAADIVALLDTFVPCRSGWRSALLSRFKGAKPSKERMTVVKSN